jgi:ribose 5-phosphate isomerase B
VKKRVVTEDDVKRMVESNALSLSGSEILTPQAKDYLNKLKNKSIEKEIKIAIGSDHRGFKMKEKVKKNLSKEGYGIVDVGTFREEVCDYPDFAQKVALNVSKGVCAKGIMIDGAGIGSSMVCNKVPGVRAALCYTRQSVINGREHNNANVLVLGSDFVENGVVGEMVNLFLKTTFAGGRHQRRVDKISVIEKNHSIGKEK